MVHIVHFREHELTGLTSARHADMVNPETFGGCVRAHVITGPRGTYPYAGTLK